MRKALLAVLALLPFLLAGCGPAAVPGPARPELRVYYAGPEGGVRAALTLAEREAGIRMVADPAQADTLVLNGAIPDPQALAGRVREGAGLVLILGPDLDGAQVGALLGRQVRLQLQSTALSLTGAKGAEDPLLREIVWNSAPQVRERVVLGEGTLEPLVAGFEDGSLVLGHAVLGRGQAFVLTAFLESANPQLQAWGYFNYLVYHLAVRAAGRSPLSFADYAGSPVPHTAERNALYALLAAMLASAGLVFWAVRRHSKAHPEALDRLLADARAFQLREAHTPWEEVGFHRPLGGFLFALSLGLVVFVPLIIYQNVILPVYILPSAQALGMWGRVTQFFNFLWQFFDMGTSVALIKFFSQHRVDEPRKGIQYVQVFVWWQALSGAVQVAGVVFVAGTFLPRTAYALYAWSIILHALIQLPGFYQVFRHTLIAWQRFDYGQILDLALATFMPMITQPVLVGLMAAWGRANPAFGASMGGLLGLGLAAYATELLTFAVGLILYRRLGYDARVLFLAHFDWRTVISAFRFGVFEMLGAIAWAIGEALVILITQLRLINYNEVWGNWTLASNFITAYTILQVLYANLMPGISEAISHGYKRLSQYYAAMGYKWGGLISAFVGAVLLAVADRFILGASGPEFVRAAAYAVPLTLWGVIQFGSWTADEIQNGSNRPYLRSAMTAMEQIIRIGLALILVGRWQIYGLIAAYFVGLLTKVLASYAINDRVCFPHRYFAWQSLAAPILAGAAHYGILRWVTGLIWRGDQITSIAILFIGLLPSLPLFAFLYGLAGGWDDDTLAEVRQAAELTGFMRPLAWLFWAATALGARLSPLHGRFPITIRREALEEARQLTLQRVRLA